MSARGRLTVVAGEPPAALRPADARPLAAPDDFFTIHQQDSRRLEIVLGRYSSPRHPLLTTTITSPPYGALKDYGDQRQIGYGQAHDEYLVDMRRVFRAVFQHTRDDGSLWVIADTLRRPSGKDVWTMQLVPFELARQAEGEGWMLRDVVVWVKDKTLPWSSRGRMRNGFEYVLFFVKSSRFKYHVERLRQPDDLEQWWVRYPERYNPEGKAPANVWAVPIPVQGSWANTAIQHACPLPADLVERMMLLSTDPGDVVFDPFAGSGVVVAEAQRLERRGLGVELVRRHIDAFHTTVLPEITERRGADIVQELRSRSEELQRTILDLRAVKYPKTLTLQARASDNTLPKPLAAYSFRKSSLRRDGHLDVAVTFVLEEGADAARYLDAVEKASQRRPASKFGITPSLSVCSVSDIPRLHRGRRLWAYVGGRTHKAHGVCRAADVDSLAALPSRHHVPPVISNVYVDESPRALRAAGA